MSSITHALDHRDGAARALDDRLATFIASDEPTDAAFERLALDCFRYQYERNEPYRRYCDRVERTPDDVMTWLDVPAVPAASFASVRLACFPPAQTALTFRSSGTTSAGERASTLELDSPALYEASLLAHFRRRVVPDGTKLRILALVPPPSDAPHSSLAYMVQHLIDAIGSLGSASFIRDGELAFDALRNALAEDAPAILFGTAFAFVHLFDRCRADGLTFALPEGSRVIETGGFKGRSREIPRAELYAGFTQVLGVPRETCASEYGMCELGSQWYDATIQDSVCDKSRASLGNTTFHSSSEGTTYHSSLARHDVKLGPHWAKAIIVDPITAQPVAHGHRGLVRIIDLSNRGSVCAVLTGDLGVERDGGFELLGRYPGAPPKGCSLDADELLSRGRG